MLTVETFENANAIITVIISLFALLSGMILWFDKRQKAFAEGAVKNATGKSDLLAAKVDEIEEDLGGLASAVGEVKKDLNMLGDRVHAVERSMETVARQSDVASLNAEVKHLSGGVTAELRVLSGMMHSFRESAYRASEKGTPK